MIRVLAIVALLSLAPIDAVHARPSLRRLAAKVYQRLNPLARRFKPVNPPGELIQLGDSAAGKALPDKLRVLVWNVAKGKHKPGLPLISAFGKSSKSFFRDFETLAGKADLTLLQEVQLSPEMNSSLAKLGHVDMVMAPNLKVVKNGQAAGVATLANGKSRAATPLVTRWTEPIADTPKVALKTRYRTASGKDLLVVNVHALNFVTRKSYIREVERLFAELAEHRGPLLVAGDFNTREFFLRGRRRALRKIAAKYGLTEVPVKKDRRPFGLDRLFVRGIKAKPITLLKRIKTSDHTALFTELEIE
jgi:endonuclease/exonuclease/phosphatase (EEP) superfamily protein YafD